MSIFHLNLKDEEAKSLDNPMGLILTLSIYSGPSFSRNIPPQAGNSLFLPKAETPVTSCSSFLKSYLCSFGRELKSKSMLESIRMLFAGASLRPESIVRGLGDAGAGLPALLFSGFRKRLKLVSNVCPREKRMTSKEKERSLTERACRWIESPEGQKKIEKASKEAQEVIEYLREVQLIDPKVLNEPITL